MARAPYGPHTVTCETGGDGDGGGFTKNCTRYATYEGARRLALVSALCDENGVSDPSADFRAVRAYHSGRARPPP